MKAYQSLEKLNDRIGNLAHLAALASWDEAVMMPKGGGEARAKAMGEIAALTSEWVGSQEMGALVTNAKAEWSELTDWQRANVLMSERRWRQATAVSQNLVRQITEQSAICQQAWREYRHANNWKDFEVHLTKTVQLAREEAACRAAATGKGPYEALVDMHQADMDLATIDRLFSELKNGLPEILEKALAKQEARHFCPLGRKVPRIEQMPVMHDFMTTLGFNFDHGRLDESHHPFCGGVPDDVRLTVRYNEDHFFGGVMAIMHETGHAIYEQNLPRRWRRQPVGEAVGMAVHESQSLFMEMQVGRSPEFIGFVTPLLQKKLGRESDPKNYWTPQNLLTEAVRVEKSFIRTEADELTYPFHVILRYEIERDLIAGRLEVKDLPEVWNEKMKLYLGLSTTGNDKNGCMQDVHWPWGAFGYFPHYTIGALLAAQLAESLKGQLEHVHHSWSKGDLSTTVKWLEKYVWSHGGLLSIHDLVKSATGEELSTKAFFRHVKKRYLEF